GRAVLVLADGDVALVAADGELVGDRLTLVRQFAADGGGADAKQLETRLVFRGGERLRALAAVAVDGDGLEAELPGLVVRLLDLFDGGVARHVDGLGDRAADERLH